MSAIWTLLAAVISFGVTALLGKWMIPFLRKLHFGQTIREEGPQWHKKKQGTPTMGGIMFIIGIVVSVLICVPLFYNSTYDDTMLAKPVSSEVWAWRWPLASSALSMTISKW